MGILIESRRQDNPEMPFCAKCGKELQEDDIFCLECGFRVPEKQVMRPFSDLLKEPSSQPVPQDLKCPSCGKPVPIGNEFCGRCGNRIAPLAPNAPPIVDSTANVSSIADKLQGTQAVSYLGGLLLALGIIVALAGFGFQSYCSSSISSGCFLSWYVGDYRNLSIIGVIIFLVGVVLFVIGRKK